MKPEPMTDEQIEQAVYEVTRNIPSIQDARAVIAARDSQWETMLAAPQTDLIKRLRDTASKGVSDSYASL